MAAPSVFDTPFQPDPNHYFIPCKVQPGMFKGEWLVTVEAVNPDKPDQILQTQSWVDERSVQEIEGTPAREQPVPGKLRVEWSRTVNGLAVLILPQPSLPLGTRIFLPEHKVEVRPA
jgi:hypothetical protein